MKRGWREEEIADGNVGGEARRGSREHAMGVRGGEGGTVSVSHTECGLGGVTFGRGNVSGG